MYEKYFAMAQVECENEVFKNLVLFFLVNRSYEKLLRKLPKFKMVSKRASVIQLYTLPQSYNYTHFHSLSYLEFVFTLFYHDTEHVTYLQLALVSLESVI